MDYIDLLALLKDFGGKLTNVRVYGIISRKTPRPSNLLSTCKQQKGGLFVKMDCCAIDLSYYRQYLKEHGIYNSTDKYFVNGSICMYVSEQGVYPDWYSSYCTLRLGSKQSDDYVVSFNFKKYDKDWIINFNSLDNIVYKEEFGIDSRICKYIMREIPIPEEVKSLRPMIHRLKVSEPFEKSNAGVQSNNDIQEVPAPKTNTVMSSNNFSNRDEVREFSGVYNDLYSVCENNKKVLNENIDKLKDKYQLGGITSYVLELATNILRHLKSKPDSMSMTGRAILKIYLSKFGKICEKTYLGVDCDSFLIDSFDQVLEYYKSSTEPCFDGFALTLFESAFRNSEEFYAGVLGVVTGIQFDYALRVLELNGLCFSKIARENPYILFALGLISFKEAELLGVCFNIAESKTLCRYRNMCILHDKVSSKDENDTLFTIKDIQRSNLPLKVTAYRANNGLSNKISRNIKYYFLNGVSVTDYNFELWSKGKYYYTRNMGSDMISLAINDYNSYGLGVIIDNKYITSTRLLEQELFVYNELWKKGAVSTGLDESEINDLIDEYESEVGFKLEEEQRNAVFLVCHESGCLTGGAGSGKTTTVACIVYVLKRLTSLDIKYGAPTGKAAKVLQSTVKEPVRTMHSLCKVGTEEQSLLDEEDNFVSESGCIYFFDEMSMVTIDLLYKVINKVENARIYFVGDVHQLNAIGKGMVFKNLLRFLPCVFLKVSKRSAENSGITYNSNVVNGDTTIPLKQTDDFILADCSDDSIAQNVIDTCKYYLGLQENRTGFNLKKLNVEPDDIQVVSPFVKEKYSWGTIKLNRELQPLFNPNKNPNERFYCINNYFAVGDRVIHTKVNLASMQWYSSYKGGTFQKIYGYGIANGEVGKLVGFFRSEQCNFLDEVEDEPDDFNYPNDLRDDEKYNGYFVVVEYYDYMEDRPFYILYRGERYDNDVEHGMKIVNKDMGYLDLFYAGSVHKLQGSQAKVVIGCLGTVNYGGFLTRNMLYTMITRAKELVILFGSVDNSPNSQLSKSRRDVADEGILTIGEYLAEG